MDNNTTNIEQRVKYKQIKHDNVQNMFDCIYGTHVQLVRPIEIEIVFWNPLDEVTSIFGHISVNITTNNDKISYSLATTGCDVNEFYNNDLNVKPPLKIEQKSYWDHNKNRNGYGFVLNTTMIQAIFIRNFFKSNFSQGKKDGVCDYKVAFFNLSKSNTLYSVLHPSFNACLTPIQKALFLQK